MRVRDVVGSDCRLLKAARTLFRSMTRTAECAMGRARRQWVFAVSRSLTDHEALADDGLTCTDGVFGLAVEKKRSACWHRNVKGV